MKFFLDRNDVKNMVAQLEAGLRNLSLDDNFAGFMWEGTIVAGATEKIRNRLSPHIPSGFIIMDAEGVNSVVRGSTWDALYVSLHNFHATISAKVKVFFLR